MIQSSNFSKSDSVRDTFDDFLGESIVLLNGEDWKFHRKVLANLLTDRALRVYMTLAIREKALQLQNVLKEASQTTQLFDTNKLLRQLTLDTTVEIVFGSKLNLLTSGKEHPFEIAFDAANHITGKRLSTPAWVWKPMRWLNIISERRLREAIGEMDEFIVNLIMEAMEHIRATEAGNQVASKNIMTILLSSEQDIAPTLVRDWVHASVAVSRAESQSTSSEET
ncbi:Cytochrome P450 [Phytophthora infestans]|uniref:Cytochrome P450 n=1 Tax=Phytophthora infestans TaxID=4787 RepID=A0A833WC86_PHYIN|nr:Cytochrome P450 [Phytophthora infestans]